MVKLINPAPSGHLSLSYGAWGGNTGYTPQRPHAGVDYGYYNADPVRSREVVSPVSGRVVSVTEGGGYNRGYGNQVIIQAGEALITLNHFRTDSIRVTEGYETYAGQRVGTMGSTGRVTGDHLHMEVIIDGRTVDPTYYYTHDLPGTPPVNEGIEDMAGGYYAKGDKADAVYFIRAHDGLRRHVPYGEYRAAELAGDIVKANGKMIPMKQADLDAIPKAPGSK